jgi:membrane associated rhomboid family serine protease
MLIPYSTDKSDNFIGYGAVGIIAACILGFLFTWPAERSFERRLWNDSLSAWTIAEHEARVDSLTRLAEEGLPTDLGEDQGEDRTVPSMDDLPADLEELVRPSKSSDDSIQHRIQAIMERESPLFRFGFHPGSGRWFPGIVLYQFLHAGFLHLLGNLVFFFAFGVAIERRYGIKLFLSFYLVGGAFAALAHVGAHAGLNRGDWPDATLVGASGSIAAVMGAFLRLYPSSRVNVFVWFLRPRLGQIPAWLFLGAWFLLEFLRNHFLGGREGGGTAYMAHVAGFVFGFALAPFLPATDEIREEEREQARLAKGPRGGGVAFSFPDRPADPAPAPAAPFVLPKIPAELAKEALERGELAKAKEQYEAQMRLWVKGTAFDLDNLADLYLGLERDHPELELDPLVLWECGLRLAADPRLTDAARACLTHAVREPSPLPASMLQRGKDVLQGLGPAPLPAGFDPPPPAFLGLPPRPAAPAVQPPKPSAEPGTSWLTD